MILAAVLALALILPPAPTARVNDYAGLLTPGERERLERLMADGERRTGAQMAIAIFPSLEGESLEDVSIRLAEQWRIGQKGLDNGVILVVFVRDRQLRLEIGYGLESVIPDSLGGAIIREALAPRFREGRYAAGLEAAVAAIHARVASGDAAPTPPPAPVYWPFVVLGLMLTFLVVMIGIEAHRTRGMVQRGGYTGGRRGWSGPIIMAPPRRGGWRTGGGGGGGFSGGGGGFGGGGASGRW